MQDTQVWLFPCGESWAASDYSDSPKTCEVKLSSPGRTRGISDNVPSLTYLSFRRNLRASQGLETGYLPFRMCKCYRDVPLYHDVRHLYMYSELRDELFSSVC